MGHHNVPFKESDLCVMCCRVVAIFFTNKQLRARHDVKEKKSNETSTEHMENCLNDAPKCL